MLAERLLILGAGKHQVPLIKQARELGFESVCVDPFEESPGIPLCDHHFLGDAFDPPTVIEAGRKLAIAGIVTIGTDQALPAWSTACEALGLPCHISISNALNATNKRLMHQRLEAFGVKMPKLYDREQLTEYSEIPESGLVVKAVDAQGQRGIERVYQHTDLQQVIQRCLRASPSSEIIIEEFVSGPEVTINVWMRDGRPALISTHDRVTFNPLDGLGICLQHVSPTVHLHLLDRFQTVAMAVAKAYGVTSGPLYIQAVIDGDQIIVVEAAARVGGGHEAQLLPHTHNFDVLGESIALALGLSKPYHRYTQVTGGSVNFVIANPGDIASLSDFPYPDDVLVDAQWYVGIGDRTPTPNTSAGRPGYFILRGENRNDLSSRANNIYESLQILDPSGRNLVFWPEEAFINTP